MPISCRRKEGTNNVSQSTSGNADAPSSRAEVRIRKTEAKMNADVKSSQTEIKREKAQHLKKRRVV
jgi:hypothetical protein